MHSSCIPPELRFRLQVKQNFRADVSMMYSMMTTSCLFRLLNSVFLVPSPTSETRFQTETKRCDFLVGKSFARDENINMFVIIIYMEIF